MSTRVQNHAMKSGGTNPPQAGLSDFYEKKSAIYMTGDSHVGAREELVLDMLPGASPLKILDVGCGSGRFLRILRDMGHEAIGVDISHQAVAAANATGVRAVTGNLETFEGFAELAGPFDAITLLDVLEHTFDPCQNLKKLKPLLKPDGCFIASVPNVACIHARLTVLVGRFPLRDAGTFDSGHIRWFTKQNLADHFAGLHDMKISAYKATPLPAWTGQGLWRLEGIQKKMLEQLAKTWPSLWGYQHVFRFSPKESR